MSDGGNGRGRARAGAARGGLALVALLAAGTLPGVARAQEVECDPGDTEVRALDFAGNRAFPDAQLASAVVLTPSSWAHRGRVRRALVGWLGTRRCIERTQVVLDRARLVLFYRSRGYPDVTVDTTVTRLGRAIGVRFRIAEGRPVLVDSLAVTWLDTVPGAARLARGLPVRKGAAFDKSAVEAAKDTLRSRLGNGGYPWAQVYAQYDTRALEYTARVELMVQPGPRTRIGRIALAVVPRTGAAQEIPEDVARRMLGVREGALYRDRDLAAARRNLYLTEAYQNVVLERDSARARTGSDSLVNLRVRLFEGYMHAARVSAGYGSIDCLRGQGDLTHRAFRAWGVSSRLEVSARVSKIGVGEPLRMGSTSTRNLLCGELKDDPYSETLNYYSGVTLRQPVLTGVPNILPTITLYSLRQSEFKAFLREVPVAVALSKTWQRNPRLPQTVSGQLEYGSTESEPAVYCAVFNACLQGDRERLGRRLRTVTFGQAITRNRANDPVNPTRGSLMRLELRHASKALGSDEDVQFNKGLGDVARYLPGGWGNVIALRLRAGAVFGRDLTLGENGVPDFVPQQERLFAGGAQTVRGFRQNELGPLVYIARSFTATPAGTDSGGATLYRLEAGPTNRMADTAIQRRVPTGGNTLVVGNVEYRMRSPVFGDVLQLVLFTDVGTVWNRQGNLLARRESDPPIILRATPGLGLRVASPFGPIRVDLGYNPYPLADGVVYYQESAGQRPLYCVTPDNDVLARRVDGVYVQDGATPCRASYAPKRSAAELRRVNISLGIAQAF